MREVNLADKKHFFVATATLAFRMKVQWFKDILSNRVARQFLWSLYYAGEAYVELHPRGVFIDKLQPLLARQLTRQLNDETRHSMLFRALLAEDGLTPVPLQPIEDLGWYLLNNIVPDVVENSQLPRPFTKDETIRYMAFLHTLELRSVSDLMALAMAAQESGEATLATHFRTILRDERFHATYTHRAVLRLSENWRQARAILDHTRRAEHKHYCKAMQHILSRFEELDAAPKNLTGRLRWSFMKMLAQTGWAFPYLPCYQHIPARIAQEDF
ncbi:MAG: hypothetical protein AB1489_06955 [Acidobacteriota bacterium]